MHIEYEATFANVEKDEIRNRLKKAGARLVKPEFMQKRIVFELPEGHRIKGGWLRVRNEGDKITMSLKVVNAGKIEEQKEICLSVDSFEDAVMFLDSIGCERKGAGHQESKREIWMLGDVEICIDEWPFLEPFVEVEGESEKSVQQACERLGFDYGQALFCAVDTLYSERYGVSLETVNEKLATITFDSENPLLEQI